MTDQIYFNHIKRFCKDLGIEDYCTPEWQEKFTKVNNLRMASKSVSQINDSLKQTKKAVVSIGCSFTHGQSAYDEELVDALAPIRDDKISTFDYRNKGHDPLALLEMSKEFFLPLTGLEPTSLETKIMETSNAYVSQLAEMLGDYTPINLGHEANSNGAGIERIFKYPIDWHLCEEVIVIWAYTDIHRFCLPVQQKGDMLNSYDHMHRDYMTLWLRSDKPENDEDYKRTFDYYFTKAVWSDEVSYWRFLQDANLLRQWIRQFPKSNMFVFPAFREVSAQDVEARFVDSYSDKSDFFALEEKYLRKITEMYPHEFIDDLNGSITFGRLCLDQESKLTKKEKDFIENNNGIGLGMKHYVFPDNWLYPCSHPSKKGHTLLAKTLYDKITQDKK